MSDSGPLSLSTEPSWASPTGGAWTYRFAGVPNRSSAVTTADGGVIFGYTYVPTYRHELVCVELETSRVRWTFSDDGNAAPWNAVPCVEGNTIYAPNVDGAVYALDVRSGELIWRFSTGIEIVTQPTLADGLLFFGTTKGDFFAIDAETGGFVWSVASNLQTAPVIITRPVAAAGMAIFTSSSDKKDHVSGRVHAYSIANGFRKVWERDAKAAITADGIYAADLLVFGCGDGTCLALNAATGAEAWHYKTSKAIVGAVAADETYALFGSADGVFYARALRNDTALRSWQVPVTQSIVTGIVTAGGEAYFGGVSADQRTAMYTLDLASAEAQSAKVLIESLEGAIDVTPTVNANRLSFMVRGENYDGVVYSIDVATTGMIDRVDFRSALIVGSYDTNTGKPAPPLFQMTATLFDVNGSPVRNANVAIWASSPDAQVSYGGVPHNLGIDINSAATFTTDVNGQVLLDATGQLGSPSLFIRPLTTDWVSGYSLQVFPDQANLDRLAALSADDLKTAQDWDGGNVLKSKYSGSAADIATAVRSTVGRTQNVSTVRLTTAPTGTAANVQRSVAPAESQHWTLDIDHDGGTATFQEIAPADAATLAVTGVDWGDYFPFVDNVVHGHDPVTKVTWHYAVDGATAIVNAAGKTYKFVVHTVEQAVNVVISILKDVVTAIEKFVQWLSFLFDWQDILDTKNAIRGTVDKSWDQLTNWVQGQLASGSAAIHEEIASWRSSIDEYFDEIAVQLTGKTLSSSQQSAGAPSQMFQPGGKDISQQSEWLIRKITHGLVPQPAAFDELEQAVQIYKTKVTEIVANDPALQNLEADLLATFTNYSKLFSDPGGYAAQELNTLIAVFRDIADLMLAFLDAVLEATLELLASAISATRRTLASPIDAGFVSDFYKFLTNDKLSTLDLGALILAVPTTLTSKILHGKAPVTSLSSSSEQIPEWVTIAGAIAYLPMIPIWSEPSNNKWVNMLIAGDAYLLQGLAIYPLVHGSATANDWVFWAAEALQPILLTVAAFAKSDLAQSALAIYFAGLCALYISLAIVYAVKFTDKYGGPVELMINLFNATPLASPLINDIGKGNELAEGIAEGNSLFGYGFAGSLTYLDLDDRAG